MPKVSASPTITANCERESRDTLAKPVSPARFFACMNMLDSVSPAPQVVIFGAGFTMAAMTRPARVQQRTTSSIMSATNRSGKAIQFHRAP